MVSVRLRRAAENDLFHIGVESREHWGNAQMQQTLRGLAEAIGMLAATPHLGHMCDFIKPGYRRLKVGAHVIYYRLDPNGDVEVARVLHGKMDPTLHLRLLD